MKLARYAKFDCFPFQKYMICGLEMGFSYVLQYTICSLHLLESSRHSRMRSKNHGTHFSGSRTSGYISILWFGWTLIFTMTSSTEHRALYRARSNITKRFRHIRIFWTVVNVRRGISFNFSMFLNIFCALHEDLNCLLRGVSALDWELCVLAAMTISVNLRCQS